MSDVKQVIVMRTDLGMRKGKMIAQGAHASIAFLTHDIDVDDWGEEGRRDPIISTRVSPAALEWVRSGRITKICVRVDSEQELLDIHNAAEAAGIHSALTRDAGLTEFGGVPTYTCTALGPDYVEKIDKITGHLTLL